MTYKDLCKDMKDFKKITAKIDKQHDKMAELFGHDIFDSPFYTPVYETLDYSLSLIKEKYNDKGGWISWFIYDNEWGKEKLEVTIKEKVISITTLKQLWQLINE